MIADNPDVLAEITEMLHGIRAELEAEITPETTFRTDLGLESIEIVALAGRLQARYGNAVNLAQFVAGLDLASIRDLRVGQLADYIAGQLPQTAQT